jgi:hypothetical protein
MHYVSYVYIGPEWLMCTNTYLYTACALMPVLDFSVALVVPAIACDAVLCWPLACQISGLQCAREFGYQSLSLIK